MPESWWGVLACALQGLQQVPGFCPLDAGTALPPPVVTTKNIFGHCQMSPGTKFLQVENRCFRPMFSAEVPQATVPRVWWPRSERPFLPFLP